MLKSISAYESPALLNMHPTMSALDLYNNLTGDGRTAPGLSLAGCIADSVVGFAALDNRWSQPVRRDHSVIIDARSDDDGAHGIKAYARAWSTEDDQGEFVMVFAHLATFMHSSMWSKAGQPPEAFIVQANWTMMASKAKRLAYIVLADKRVQIYWVDRDEDVIARLQAAVVDMNQRIRDANPPAIDEPAQSVAKPADASSTDANGLTLDELTARYRSSKLGRAMAQDKLQLAEHLHDTSYEALKTAIKPGANHEYDGVRTHHNAKTGRLTEEKIDGLYF